MSRGHKLQTAVCSCKEKPSAGDYLLLSDEEYETVTHMATCVTDKNGEPQQNTLSSKYAKHHFNKHLNNEISV